MTREEILNSEVGKNLLEEFENYTRTRLIGVGKSIFFEDFKKDTSFLPNSWILYMDGNKNIVRRIINDDEYFKSISRLESALENKYGEALDEKYGDWMIHSAVIEDKKKGWNYCLRTATNNEIHKHLLKIALKKGFAKGVEVMNRGTIVANLDLASTMYYSKNDQFFCAGICLYQNGYWGVIKEKPKFTFGGQEVTFQTFSTGGTYSTKTIQVICKGEIGTHYDISQILTYYNRPIKFGTVRVKGYTLKSNSDIKWDAPSDVIIVNKVWEANDDINKIEEVTIGCLIGKYKELVTIFEECQRLLKESK